ncbi:4Fe-4S dicluster domain-containing protein [Dehalogenimonas alkenigignens]|uniref:4Fe-4S dicluster domain n=1 Tax=Dehalogenimonas alkenigignens TaxID=1217799 RepID=A0A0W0GJ77_9CHLR|nr:4Fe-4S dicluster domain-containing protein [Dehalogenimonas alkenigignens]KTB48578.1 4Fe-4S dicluster domain [Dehalogenimonas alkenigignens]PVV84981.1 4Fe-4S dicluster domain-containing protein [Dehalogenimonas alkenigignens]
MNESPAVAEYELVPGHISEFASGIKALHGVDVNLCYQCRKCTSGCPLTEFMDMTPTQVIHAVRLGLKDMVLNTNTYWLCVACGTCTARCPQETGLLKVMDALANIAIKEGIAPKERAIAEFYKTGLSIIENFGMMYEAGVAGLLSLKTGNIGRDARVGLRMMKKGKLDVMPHFQNSREMKKLFKKVAKKEQELARS